MVLESKSISYGTLDDIAQNPPPPTHSAFLHVTQYVSNKIWLDWYDIVVKFFQVSVFIFFNPETSFDRLISQAADTSLNLRRTPSSEMTQVKRKEKVLKTGHLEFSKLTFGWTRRTCIRGNRFCHPKMKAGTIARLNRRPYTNRGARRTGVVAVARSLSADWIKVLRAMAVVAAATERNQKMASSASTCLHHTGTNPNFHASTLKRLSVRNIHNMTFHLLFLSVKYYRFICFFQHSCSAFSIGSWQPFRWLWFTSEYLTGRITAHFLTCFLTIYRPLIGPLMYRRYS